MSQPTWIGYNLGGRYRIESVLGQGGMSAVYRAVDPNLRRTVAVKLIHPHLSTDPEFVRRFEEEAAAVAQLRHPNIIQVYDFNHDGDTYYMVLEFLPGETLQARLKSLAASKQRMPLITAIQIMATICDAVAYAHNRGLVHRDLKPGNVMLSEPGQVILMDFGVAKIMGGQHHTATGAVIGTPIYMSPEQVRGERLDHRADIYSLGVMLYEMSAGKPPFEADSAMSIMLKHLHEPVPDISQIIGDAPPQLAHLLDKALAKDAAQRYQTAAEMAAALRKVEAQLLAESRPAPEAEPAQVAPSRREDEAPPPKSKEAAPPPVRKEAVPPAEQAPQKSRISQVTSGLRAAESASRSGLAQPPPPSTQVEDGPLAEPTVQTPAEETAEPIVQEAAPPAKPERETWVMPPRPAGQRNMLIGLAAGAVALLAVIVLGVLFVALPGLDRLPSGQDMVKINGGLYSVGIEAPNNNQLPFQNVELDTFWIDQYEVTNAQYAEFVAGSNISPPAGWPGETAPAGLENHPVAGITWDQAARYCESVNKRLPDEAEWEVAARGTDGRLYPWGNNQNTVQLPSGTYPVGTVRANRSPFGIFDMAGNVWEWVDDPVADAPDGQQVIRGGSFDLPTDLTHRLVGDPNAGTMIATAGVRCAADAVSGEE